MTNKLLYKLLFKLFPLILRSENIKTHLCNVFIQTHNVHNSHINIEHTQSHQVETINMS